jgi:hypothetical protein
VGKHAVLRAPAAEGARLRVFDGYKGFDDLAAFSPGFDAGQHLLAFQGLGLRAKGELA